MRKKTCWILTTLFYLVSVVAAETWDFGWIPFNKTVNDWVFWGAMNLLTLIVITVGWIVGTKAVLYEIESSQ
jgi:hypothetical protein